MLRFMTGLDYNGRFLVPYAVFSHTKTCPTKRKTSPSKDSRCPGKGGGKSGGKGGAEGGALSIRLPDFKRAEKSGPVRLGFIPEECFKFFNNITGVSGPYVFGIVVTNYMLSKEIYIMEHEYYLGISVAIIICFVTTKAGAAIGTILDKEVDDVVAVWQKSIDDEIAGYNNQIKECKDSQWRAEGQVLLMDAKKENITMQLEAAYRERMMQVYKGVKGRMDYQIKRYRSETRIHQKWMIGWILENVRKSITPEFEQAALDSAIRDLAAAASQRA